MGVLAPDGTGVGLGHEGGEAAAAVDVAVGLRHGLVADVQAVLVGVEAVGVLHVELADSYKPSAGTGLVTELGLNLVEHEGEVAVALYVGAGDVGDDLLVSGGHDQSALAAVLQGEEVVAKGVPATGLFPEFDRLEDGQAEFLASCGVYLLADDVLDLAEGAPCQGQVGVDASGDLGDHARLEHEAVADGLRLGGVGAEGLGDQSSEAQDYILFMIWKRS